jgi:hypothetical protein
VTTHDHEHGTTGPPEHGAVGPPEHGAAGQSGHGAAGQSGHGADGPSGPGSVVLDIGPGTGALVLYAPPDLDRAEIEISPAGDPHAPRTHSAVRRRLTSARAGPDPSAAEHVSYAAVYPALAVGSYTIWRDAGTPAGRVTIIDGQVTTWHWPAAASSRSCR